MAERNDNIDSVFRYILIAAQRAEQLINGARPRVATKLSKPTTIALAELDAGAVPWRPVTPEEYEQLRQEELVRLEVEEQPLPAVPLATALDVEVEEGDEADSMDEAELEEELRGPDFDADELEDVDEPLGEDLLVEDVE